uniref:uncharacterized protein LOC122588435 n=1 Tax=Erigeron canadensis TaxID=72917 RepID=UPI001CB88B99|nr:uncharacterized protein LOC122588435 [Erigeron canadensis]
MASSSLILKKLRQTSCSNYLTISSFLSPPTALFGTSRIPTRSIVPYFQPPVCGGRGASIMSCFINAKEFHVHVSRDDSVRVNAMTRIWDTLNPRGWSFVRLYLDEEDLPQVEVDRLLFRIRAEETNEGVCVKIIMHRVKCHNLKVFVEDNSLMCQGLKARGKTHDIEFPLPERTYQLSDVKAKLENGVLMITIANLTREELYKKRFSITSDN